MLPIGRLGGETVGQSPSAWMSLHATAGVGPELALAPLLVFGGIASVALAGLGIVAFSRRRSRSYLLVAIALVALALKAFLGGLWLIEVLPTVQHDLLEHGLDLAIAALLMGAVYYARTAPGESRPEREGTR